MFVQWVIMETQSLEFVRNAGTTVSCVPALITVSNVYQNTYRLMVDVWFLWGVNKIKFNTRKDVWKGVPLEHLEVE